MSSFGLDDMDIARRLQEEYDKEAAAQLAAGSDSTLSETASQLNSPFRNSLPSSISPVDPSLEFTDPNPDIRELFLQYNEQFFWSRLSGIEVKWSPRMTLCAGLCVYEGHGGLCSVRLSLPLLKLRPRKDLVETLLDHDDHGPNFKKHMGRINKETGANISIYHTFHDEVTSYQQHWWKCDGPCQKRPPYYGMVKRAMNRPPSNRDPWFNQHQSTCGGTFIKVKEPEGYGQKKGKAKAEKSDKAQNSNADIRAFVGKGATLGGSSTSGKPFSNGSTKGPSGPDNKDDSKGKGLAVITNGVLTNKKIPGGFENRPGATKPSDRNSSLLFSSVASTSGSSMPKRSDPAFNHKVASGSGLNKSLGSKRSSSCSSPSSSNKNAVKGKGKFNDNITLLELFKLRQAREKTKQDGGDVKDRQDLKSSTDGEAYEKARTKSDFIVDLTESDTDDFNTTSSSTDSKRPSDLKSKGKGNDKKHWKNIFPTMSGKKDRGRFKGIGKNKFPKKFVSVCEGGDYDDVRLRKNRTKGDKIKLKYVIDELDSNDGLWDEGSSSASASEDKLVKTFQKTFDHNKFCQNSSSDENSAKSDTSNVKNLSRQDIVPKDDESKKPSASLDKEEFNSGPSTSGLNGHVLGRGESGLSFLAQMRRKLQDKRKEDQSMGGSRSHTASNTSSIDKTDLESSKRRSDIAFGDEDIVPRSKRPNNATSERFIAGRQDLEDENKDVAPGMVTCPSCIELVREADINDHLDRCLE